MKRFSLALILAAATLAASAQTSSKPSTATTPSSAASKKTTSATSTASTATKAPEPWVKLPAGVPVKKHGLTRTVPIVVHYQDIEIGKGAVGESGKLWHLKYWGYRAGDSTKPDTWIKFDSWDEHKRPKMGADGKPELDADKHPILGDPEPASFPQGVGGTIPGFDFGLEGMKIGGQRRIFIPWQLGYGTRDLQPRKSPAPGMPDFPGIPPKSDLIFDVELVDVTDMPQRPAMPMMPPHGAQPNGAPGHPTFNAPSGTAPATPAPSSKPATPPPPTDPTKPTTPTPAPSTTPTQPQSK